MAAPGTPPGEGDIPTYAHVPLDSDTPTASSEVPSEVPSARPPPRPVPRPLSLETLETNDRTDASLEPAAGQSKHAQPSARNGRSLSLAHLSGPIKRKPLSSTASPFAVRFSKGPAAYADALADLPKPEQRFARSCSVDSPTLYEFPDKRSLLATAGSPHTVSDWPASPDTSPPPSPASNKSSRPAAPAVGAGTEHSRDAVPGDNNPAEAQASPAPPDHESQPAETASLDSQGPAPYELDDIYSLPGSPESHASRRTAATAANEDDQDDDADSRTMSMFTRRSPPPQLNLGTNTRDASPAAPATPLEQNAANLNKPLPKSPASSKLSVMFGWATSPSPTATTDFSEKNYSPLPSPTSSPNQLAAAAAESCETPVATRKPALPSAAQPNPLQYCEAYLHTPADSVTAIGQLEEMEDELKAISAELAASIRREMDLEDLVDRLQEQINNPQAPGKRTSDYFSDSGYSSAKFSDYDQAKEEISQIQRRAEQEKAQLRLELTNKLQEEREKRRQLDQQIQELSRKASQLDPARLDGGDAGERVRELEAACEDLSRRLSEERQAKTDLEDLLGTLRGELQSTSNERDNLRDEVVPQLRARVEGLEAEAADQARLAYDASKLQQELQQLRSENAELQMLSSHSEHGEPVSSRSLEQAYEDLQAAYADALERIRNLEESVRADEKTQLAMRRLEQSLSAAVSDRDQARGEADTYRQQVEALRGLEQQHLEAERDLAAQLHESARRVEELAQQVRAQLETNAALRTRLADTIARGDAEQRVNKDRIAGMQTRLRTLEEQVVAAQTSAEERVARHEEEVLALRDAHSAQLRRLRDPSGARPRGWRGDGAGQRYFPAKSPLSPLISLRSHQPDSRPSNRMSTPPALLDVDGHGTRSRPHSAAAAAAAAALRRAALERAGKDGEENMAAQMQALRRRVSELEGALASADAEMQEVVGRMNAAQMEVLQLLEQREEAVRETRRLQKRLEAERLAAFEKRWESLTTEVA
ncbi:hypothetical protein VTH06DRAFT_8094 [Thermothelomyces fergusii]